MKRPSSPSSTHPKKPKPSPPPSSLTDDLIFEILRRADPAAVAAAACVSRSWRRTAEDERLWEEICTRRLPHARSPNLRAVVSAIGGFRRLHKLYLRPLSSSSSTSSYSLASIMPFSGETARGESVKKGTKRWGKDEMQLSLSLLSIQHFHQKMGFGNRR